MRSSNEHKKLRGKRRLTEDKKAVVRKREGPGQCLIKKAKRTRSIMAIEGSIMAKITERIKK